MLGEVITFSYVIKTNFFLSIKERMNSAQKVSAAVIFKTNDRHEARRGGASHTEAKRDRYRETKPPKISIYTLYRITALGSRNSKVTKLLP